MNLIQLITKVKRTLMNIYSYEYKNRFCYYDLRDHIVQNIFIDFILYYLNSQSIRFAGDLFHSFSFKSAYKNRNNILISSMIFFSLRQFFQSKDSFQILYKTQIFLLFKIVKYTKRCRQKSSKFVGNFRKYLLIKKYFVEKQFYFK